MAQTSEAKARVWIDVPPLPAGKTVLTTALERGFGTFVCRAADAKALAGLGRFRLIARDGDALTESGKTVGVACRITSVAEQDTALALAGAHDVVLVSAEDWRVIPYENLIAAYQAQATTLAAVATDAADVRLLLETLEVGVDAAVVHAATPDDVLALADALASDAATSVPLVRGRVTAVTAAGSGDRVCVDTASMLKPGEGLLIGSASSALVLVAAETLESGYVAARPFRVNAGAVHAYVLLPNGKTKYLSEVKAGDEVLVVDPHGAARSVTVGRAKVETRPMLLVHGVITTDTGDRAFTTLVQNAETIRLVTPDGASISVVDVAPGDEVLLRVEDVGRHFGTPVKETITER